MDNIEKLDKEGCVFGKLLNKDIVELRSDVNNIGKKVQHNCDYSRDEIGKVYKRMEDMKDKIDNKFNGLYIFAIAQLAGIIIMLLNKYLPK